MYEANTIMNIIRSDVASHLRGSMFRQAIYADMATNRGNSTSVVSEMDMGYVRGTNRWGSSIKTTQLTEAEHQKMADFYEWIIQEYFRIIPPEQQWGICQWCTTDAPTNSGWRGGEPVGIWDLNYNRKHVYAGFVRGLSTK